MDPLTIWILALATLWLIRMLIEELVAAIRSRPSPRIARREARERLAEQHGTPTVGQAISNRLAHRIENPPDRRWLAEFRAYAEEWAADAVAEARVRRHVKVRQRARGWTAQTGGQRYRAEPPPPPEPEPDDVTDTEWCTECGVAAVVPPDEECDACRQAAPPPPPPFGFGREVHPDNTDRCCYSGPTDSDIVCGLPATEYVDALRPDGVPVVLPACDEHAAAAHEVANPSNTPSPAPGKDTDHDREEPPMPTTTSETHEINPDVRDPRTALAFADNCRGFSLAAAKQVLDVLAANMEQKEVGSGPVGQIRTLADNARNHAGACQRSVDKYAEHVVVQDDITSDAAVKNTVRRTYLDTRGADSPPRPGDGKRIAISATDVFDPGAAAGVMDKLVAMYAKLRGNAVNVKDAHTKQRVSGEPLRFLDEQIDLATTIESQAQDAAREFRREVQRRNDGIGKDPSLHGTQQGRWLDPAKA